MRNCYTHLSLLLLILLPTLGKAQGPKNSVKQLTTQTINHWNTTYYDSARKLTYLIGFSNRAGLQGINQNTWFDQNYAQYQPNLAVLQPVQAQLQQTDILVFMGTWCGDSRREVPRLYKILDAAGVGDARLRVIALHPNKQGPQHEEAGQHIHHVATIILVRNGQEIGRIIEAPQYSLEEDLAAILKGENYAPKYIFSEGLARLIEQGPAVLSRELANFEQNNYMRLRGVAEWATYGNVLRQAGRYAEASILLEFASREYNDPSLYEGLANVYLELQQKDNAKNCLNDALRVRAQQAEVLRKRLAAIQE